MLKHLSVLMVILLVLTALCSGCGKSNEDIYAIDESLRTDGTVQKTVSNEVNLSSDPDKAPILLLAPMGRPGFEVAIEGYLRKAGVNVDLNSVAIYNESTLKSYVDRIERQASAGSVDAFFVNTMIRTTAGTGTLEDLSLSNPGTALPVHAPRYYSILLDSDLPDHLIRSLHYIPVNIQAPDPHAQRLTVTLLKSPYQRYEQPIRNMSDYLSFIAFANDLEYPCPALLPAPELLLELAIQDSGYYRLDALFPQNIPSYAVMPMDRTSATDIEYALNVPAIVDRMDSLHQLMMQGHIQLDAPPEDIASVLLPKQNVSEYQVIASSFAAADDIILQPLYSDTPVAHPLLPQYDSLYLAANAPNAQGVLEFLEYIHLDQSHYDLFRYGELDTDYSLQGDRYQIERIDGSQQMYRSYLMRPLFMTHTYERYSNSIPENFQTLFDNIRPSGRLMLTDSIQAKRDILLSQIDDLYNDNAKQQATTLMLLHMQWLEGLHQTTPWPDHTAQFQEQLATIDDSQLLIYYQQLLD